MRACVRVRAGKLAGAKLLRCACGSARVRAPHPRVARCSYCAEHTGYHHGEQSLYGTIVNMAQDFVGSNNLPLLEPVGQFGTRLQGGKDAASPRYIFTRLQPHARLLFPEADDETLARAEDDGQLVEPVTYVPVIPTALVNGAEGIGTGWSTSVPMHHPVEVADQLLSRLQRGAPFAPLTPWVRGFRGAIEADERGFVSRGVCAVTRETASGGTVEVSELPVGTWTEQFKARLSKMVADGELRGFAEHHSEREVRFELQLSAAQLQKLRAAGAESALRLSSRMSTTNMHMFGASGAVVKFRDTAHVMEEYFPVRLRQVSGRSDAASADPNNGPSAVCAV